MPSKLTQIKNALIVEIQKVGGLGGSGSNLKMFDEEVNFPAAYTSIGSEAKENILTKRKEATADFTISTVVKGDDPLQLFLDLYESIEKEIEDDPTLSGLVIDVTVTGFNALITSVTIAENLHVADIFVVAIYRHTRAAP